jgi:hypothetical protein
MFHGVLGSFFRQLFNLFFGVDFLFFHDDTPPVDKLEWVV